MISLEEAAAGFAAVGSEPRMEVLLCLIRAGAGGLPFGEIQTRTGVPASTLAHHLRFLAAAGLVIQTREGRQTISRPDYGRLRSLSDFLLAQCCIDEIPSIPSDQEAAS